MSIRAFRLNQIEYKKSETFNLWHDNFVVDSLEKGDYLSPLNNDSCGIIEIPIGELEDIATKLEERIKQGIDGADQEDTVKLLRQDLEWAKQREEEYIQYYCF